MPDITLHKAIVHELVKEQHKPIQPSNLRTTVLDSSSETVKKLLSDIVDVYGDRENNAHFGTFIASGNRGRFPDDFDAYSELDLAAVTDAAFITLSNCAMGELSRTADAQSASSGGYIFVGDYARAGTRYFLVAMIKQTPGMTITATLEPEELMRLDLDRLHQAARINFSKLALYLAAEEEAKKEINYLTFISPSRETKTSGYFITALGCSAGNTASRATKAVIEESTAFFHNNEKLKKNRDAFRKSLMEYLSDKEASGQSVRISEIGQLVTAHIPTEMADESEELVNELIKKLNSDDVGVPAEFPVHKSELKKHTHITGRSAHWRLEFDRDALGVTDQASIFYDKDRGTITFKDIPEDLQHVIESELASHSE